MTTIAVKDGIISYDSRTTIGGTIVDDKTNKRFKRNGVNFFVCGSLCDVEEFIDVYFGETASNELDMTSLVVERDGEILRCGAGETGIWKEKLEANAVFAMGTGSDCAYTAMDMGATSKEAVKMAIKRDCLSGGRIRTFKIPEG